MVGMVDRYQNDPQIHALVDSLEHAMETLNFTPSEVRDCAMLAAVNFEQRHARRLFMEPAQRSDNNARDAIAGDSAFSVRCSCGAVISLRIHVDGGSTAPVA